MRPNPIPEPLPAVRVTEVRPRTPEAAQLAAYAGAAPYDQGNDGALTPLDLSVLLALITRTIGHQPNPVQLEAVRVKLRALIAGGGA